MLMMLHFIHHLLKSQIHEAIIVCYEDRKKKCMIQGDMRFPAFNKLLHVIKESTFQNQKKHVLLFSCTVLFDLCAED